MATAKARANLIKAKVDQSWMVCHALCLRDSVRDLEHKVKDHKEWERRISQLKRKVEEMKNEKNFLKGNIEHFKKIEVSLLRIDFELSNELKRPLQEREETRSKLLKEKRQANVLSD